MDAISVLTPLLALFLAGAPLGQEERGISPKRERKIISLIRDSVSLKEAGAEKAQESLIEIGLPAVPLLKQALDEERDRAYTILYVLNRIYQEEAGGEGRDLPARLDSERRQGAKYLRRKLQGARKLHEEGDPARALRILDAIRDLEPEINFLEEIEALRVEVKSSLYQATVLSAAFETDREGYEAGEVIQVEIRLRNPGKQALVIPLQEEGVNIGAVRLERWAYFSDGTWQRDFHEEALPQAEEIRIEPGESYTLPYLIDTRGIDLPEGSYVALWLSGKVRPPSVIQGVENRARLIEIPRKEIPLLPVGQGDLSKEPARRLKEALREDRTLSRELTGLGGEKGERRKEISARLGEISGEILPLAFLAARKGLWRTNEILVGALEEASPEVAATAMKALSLLNGKKATLKKRWWQIWWLKVE